MTVLSAYLYGHPLLPGLVAVHVDVPLQVELGGEALATAEVIKISIVGPFNKTTGSVKFREVALWQL